MQTNNGKKGGLLKGKPHYDKNGKPMGGIKAIVTDSGQQVELEGGEVIINKEASKKHWKELSRINQSAGGGVPILPPDEDDGGDEFGSGGRTIEFNPNHLPNRWVYQYAKNIKEKYPKVWAVGGNIFGNEAFKNLERALKRGYWTDNEKWMYIKWQSFNARHSGDTRIAGIIANLKWLNKVDKGWDYMKQLIEEEIRKKYGNDKMAKGGVVTYKNKYNKKYGYDKDESHTLNEVAKDTGVSKKGIQQIYNKGIGAYKNNPESVRPNVKSKEQWAMARVYSAVMGGKASRIDANELKMGSGGGLYDDDKQFDMVVVTKQAPKDGGKQFEDRYTVYARNINEAKEKALKQWKDSFGQMSDLSVVRVVQQNTSGTMQRWAQGGELAKGIKVEKEHSRTAEKLYNRKITPQQAYKEIAKDHLKEDSHYYSKLNKFESKMDKGGFIGLPSTDRQTWNAEYKVGDYVRVRKDWASKTDVNWVRRIEKIIVEKSQARPENPKGKLYKLSNLEYWEGKDLEPADDSSATPTQSGFSGSLNSNLPTINKIIRDGGVFKTTVDTSNKSFPRYFTIKPNSNGSDLVEIKCWEENLQVENIIIYPAYFVQNYIWKSIWVKEDEKSTETTTTSTTAQPTKQKQSKQAKEPIVQYDYGAGLREFIINNLQNANETTLEEEKHLIVDIFNKHIK